MFTPSIIKFALIKLFNVRFRSLTFEMPDPKLTKGTRLSSGVLSIVKYLCELSDF